MGNETQKQRNAQKQDPSSEMFENITNSAIKKAGNLSSAKEAKKISKDFKEEIPDNRTA